jgi:hypothetical protein
LILGSKYLVRQVIESIVGFRGSLFRAENESDRRIFSRLHPMFAGVIEIKMHLPGISVAELAHLQIYNDQTPQATVKEQEIDTKPGVIELTILAQNMRKMSGI